MSKWTFCHCLNVYHCMQPNELHMVLGTVYQLSYPEENVGNLLLPEQFYVLIIPCLIYPSRHFLIFSRMNNDHLLEFCLHPRSSTSHTNKEYICPLHFFQVQVLNYKNLQQEEGLDAQLIYKQIRPRPKVTMHLNV
jgi:hypothetical protein